MSGTMNTIFKFVSGILMLYAVYHILQDLLLSSPSIDNHNHHNYNNVITRTDGQYQNYASQNHPFIHQNNNNDNNNGMIGGMAVTTPFNAKDGDVGDRDNVTKANKNMYKTGAFKSGLRSNSGRSSSSSSPSTTESDSSRSAANPSQDKDKVTSLAPVPGIAVLAETTTSSKQPLPTVFDVIREQYAKGLTSKSSSSTTSFQPPVNGKGELLVSLDKPAFADVRGNLGPARVVTSESMDNWLKDRWQASADLRGIPLPGKHWVMMDLLRPCYVSRFLIDWEEGYSHDFAIYGSMQPIACQDGRRLCENVTGSWEKIVDTNDLKRTKQLMPTFDTKHVVMKIEAVREVANRDAAAFIEMGPNKVKKDAVGPYQSLKLFIRKPAGKWGVSIWRWQVWGKYA